MLELELSELLESLSSLDDLVLVALYGFVKREDTIELFFGMG